MEKEQPGSKKFIIIGISIIAMGITLTTTLKNGIGFAILGMGAILFIVGMKKRNEEQKANK